MSRTILFRISAGFLVGAFIFLASALYLSDRYLAEQQRLVAAGDIEGAMQSVRLAAQLNPFGPEPLQAESFLMQQQGRNEGAEEALQEAVRRDPNNYIPYVLLGNLQLNGLDDPAAAAQTYQEALELNPRATVVIGGLIQALLRVGELEEAKRQYEKVQEYSEISLQDRYILGRIYSLTGEPEKGLEVLQETRRQASAGLEGVSEAERLQRESLIQSIDLAIANALVIQGRYEEAYETVAQSGSPQAPAILELLEADPEGYRQTVLESELY